MGVLDGLTREEIEARYAPQSGNATLISKLLAGPSVIVDKPALRAVLQDKINALVAQGCDVVLMLCTGEFRGLEGRTAWLVEPDQIVPPACAEITGDRQVGIVVPLASRIDTQFRKWAYRRRSPICAAASPHAEAEQTAELIAAARQLRDEGPSC